MPQTFWIAYRHTDLIVQPGVSPDNCVQITVPDKCPVCSHPITIADPGNAKAATSLHNTCPHVGFYGHIWKMRILQVVPGSEVVVKRELPPQQCAGCGLTNEYAVPNKPDGTYVCYNCR